MHFIAYGIKINNEEIIKQIKKNLTSSDSFGFFESKNGSEGVFGKKVVKHIDDNISLIPEVGENEKQLLYTIILNFIHKHGIIISDTKLKHYIMNG